MPGKNNSQITSQAFEDNLLHWSKLGHWSLDETIVISLGRYPKKLPLREHSIAPDRDADSNKEFISRYADRKETITRAIESGQLKTSGGTLFPIHITDTLSPISVVQWAQQWEISFPEDVAEMVYKYHQAQDRKTAYKNIQLDNEKLPEKINTLERDNKKLRQDKAHLQNSLNTSNKFFAAIARDTIKKPTISKIKSCLERQGLKPADKTIRDKYNFGLDQLGVKEFVPAEEI